MIRSHGMTVLASLTLGLLTPPPAFGQPVCPENGIYELLPDSEMLVDCRLCELAEPRVQLSGRFRLDAGRPMGEDTEFPIHGIEFRSRLGRLGYRVAGDGMLILGKDGTQSIFLNLALDGGDLQNLSGGGAVDPAAPWPAMKVEAAVAQPGTAAFFILSVKLVAAPLRAAKFTPYSLRPESYLLIDCEFCKRLNLPIPIDGTFLLGEMASRPSVSEFRIDCIDFRSTNLEEPPGLISGWGSYERFEEFALSESMTLDLRLDIGGELFNGAVLESGFKHPVAPFPNLEIDLVQVNPVDPNTIFKLHLVAGPSGALVTPFRRGDTNDDGRVDLSDPVAMLNWLFLGSDEPPCREATDTNTDRASDLSDPVYVLSFLFLGGDEPAAPGPFECGAAPEPAGGCARYDSCK